MARRLRRKDLKKDEFVETALDFGQWLETHWPTVVGWASGVAVIALAALLWFWYAGHREKEAVGLLAQGMDRYQQAEKGAFTGTEALEQALQLFEQASHDSRNSAAGRSARYYQGATLYRLGRNDEAIKALEEVRGYDEPHTLKGIAGALLADVYVETGQQDRAVSLLQEMAEESEPAFPPDQTLIKLGHIYADKGDMDEAQKVWHRVVDEYPQTAGAMEASVLLNDQG